MRLWTHFLFLSHDCWDTKFVTAEGGSRRNHPDAPKSWQLRFLLICGERRAPSLFLPAWQSSLFSLKRMNEDKRQSKMEQESHRLLWFMMAGSSASPLLSSSLRPICLPLPRPANGELRSARGDTVKPSAAADYGAKYWSPPHTCQNFPPSNPPPFN